MGKCNRDTDDGIKICVKCGEDEGIVGIKFVLCRKE
jgi:ribosomal protein S14